MVVYTSTILESLLVSICDQSACLPIGRPGACLPIRRDKGVCMSISDLEHRALNKIF